jgi:hypothetical protein
MITDNLERSDDDSIRSASFRTDVNKILTLLVNSKPCGKAGLHMTFGGQGDRVHPFGETHSYGF